MIQPDLSFFLGDRKAGSIRRSGRGPLLSYDDHYASSPRATPLSTAFALSARGDYPPYRVASWLDGLLPDNDRVQKQWRDKFGIKGRGAMPILASPVGLDCPGAVQFCPEGDEGDVLSRTEDVKWLSDEERAELVASLRDRDTTWHGSIGAPSGRFSLSGAQAKTAVVIESGKWGVPEGTRPSTHIVKPTINDPDYPEQALNEHLCLAAAGHLQDVDAVRTEVAEVGGIQCIIVTRYDRVRTDDGRVVRIHQEDMCQALGVAPGNKYQGDGGPTPAAIAQAIRTHSADPDGDAMRFFDALIYNWVIVGTDAHAKNYSFLLDRGSVRLAPLYDVASMLPYVDNSGALNKQKLAMKVGKSYRIAQSDRKSAWHSTGEAMGLDGDWAVDRAENLARKMPAAFDQAAQGLPAEFARSEIVAGLLHAVDQRSMTCARVSTAVGPPPRRSAGSGSQALSHKSVGTGTA